MSTELTKEQRAALIVNCEGVNHPADGIAAMRIVGFLVPEQDAGLSDGIEALRVIRERFNAFDAHMSVIADLETLVAQGNTFLENEEALVYQQGKRIAALTNALKPFADIAENIGMITERMCLNARAALSEGEGA